ncbi:hypothetical protein [Cupriavidus sp. 8B]
MLVLGHAAGGHARSLPARGDATPAHGAESKFRAARLARMATHVDDESDICERSGASPVREVVLTPPLIDPGRILLAVPRSTEVKSGVTDTDFYEIDMNCSCRNRIIFSFPCL